MSDTVILSYDEYTRAFLELGPSVVLVADELGVSHSKVNKALKQPSVKAVYDGWVERIIQSVQRFGGNYSTLASIYDVPRHRIVAWLHDSPRLRLAASDFDEEIVDLAEMNLVKALKQEERWATEKVLNTRGAKRGWGERMTLNLDEESERLGVSLPVVLDEITRLIAASSESQDEDVSAE